jgi:hypothetical protein
MGSTMSTAILRVKERSGARAALQCPSSISIFGSEEADVLVTGSSYNRFEDTSDLFKSSLK